MTDVVAREIMGHRMDGVRRATQQVRGAHTDLRRFLPDMEIRISPEPEGVVSAATYLFEEQLRKFIARHDGILLDLHSPGLVRSIFDRYFAQAAPFGGGRDKKHEFPDAAALLSLEAHAQEQGVRVIAVSADSGWMQFASSSEHIYCVPDLAALSGLFVATSLKMRRFSERVADLLFSRNFQQEVRKLLQRKLVTMPWSINPRENWKVDAGVVGAALEAFEIHRGSLKVWATPDESTAVAEVMVAVECRLEIEAYAYRHKYKSEEKEDLSHTNLIVDHGFEIPLVLEFYGFDGDSDPADALNEMSLLEQSLPVNLPRIKFPGLPENSWAWEDFDDDVPF